MGIEYKIPLFDLNYDTSEEEALVQTIKSKWISTGPKTVEFEDRFADMIGAGYAVAVSNCTSALHLALNLLEICDGDEVICPSLTFVATVNSIKYVRANPVFCDIIDSTEPTIDPQKIEELITTKTKAVVVMHYGGFSCRMNEIKKICKEYNLKLIEDACHGPLSEYKGKKLGTFGDVSCFSFFSNKNISTGEGGMLVTNSHDLFKKAQLLRSHGMTSLSYERSKGHSTNYDVLELGYNYRMDDIRASLGLVQLTKLKKDIEKRIEIRNCYKEQLLPIQRIEVPFFDNKEFCSNYIFPIVLKNSTSYFRDDVRKRLMDKGIQTSIHYPAVHKFRLYDQDSLSLPNTEYFSDNEITLPLHSKLGNNEIDYIVCNLKSILSNHND